MPYLSDSQRRWAHTQEGTKALGGAEKVKEWDKTSKGLDLPDHIKKHGKSADYLKHLYRKK